MMKKIFYAIAIFFGVALQAQDFYVSSSQGSDAARGDSASPLKSISAVPKHAKKIFLRCGDVFYEQLCGFRNCEITSYGRGNKPVLCGLKIVAGESAWERLPNDVWRVDLTKEECFGGLKKSSSGKINNIGAVYDIVSDKLYGHLVHRFSAMNAYGDFFVSDNVWSVDVNSKSENFRYLYFRSRTNPSAGGARIGLLSGAHGILNLRGCVVKNIAVKGFGMHGVCKVHDTRIENVDIDLIGGSLLIGYKTWVRFGNGAEFWIGETDPCNNNLLAKCKISRVFDCGSTIQGHGDGKLKSVNNKFIDNVFYKCCQAFEHFNRSKNSTSEYVDCEFSGNKCFGMGDNGFGTSEIREANLLSGDSAVEPSGLLVKDNLFFGGNLYFCNKYPAKMQNNKFYIPRGAYLYFNPHDFSSTIWANGKEDIARAKAVLKNSSDEIFVYEPSDSDFINSMKEKILGAR